jgi:hypothetical protein
MSKTKPFVLTEYPESTLASIRLLLFHFGKPVVPHGTLNWPITPLSLRRAKKLLGVVRAYDRWQIRGQWERRLKSAGINPLDPLDIIDVDLWSLAWLQITTMWNYSISEQTKLLAMGRTADYPKPVIKAFELPQSPEVKFDMFHVELKDFLIRKKHK